MKMPFDIQPEGSILALPQRTMADVHADLQKKEGKWPAYKRREMIGDVRSLEKKLKQPLSAIIADSDLLMARLDVVGWKAVKLNRPRWRNWKSNINTAILETGINRRTEGTRREAYPPAWVALFSEIEAAIERGDEKEFRAVSLRLIASQAIKMAIDDPADVSQAVVDAMYAEYFEMHGRIETELGRKIKGRTKHFENAIRDWNRAWREQNQRPWFKGIPCIELARLGKPKRALYIQHSEMHPDLVADITRAIAEIAGTNKQSGRRTSRMDGGTPDIVERSSSPKGRSRKKLGTDQIAGLHTTARAIVTAAVKVAGMELSELRSLKQILSFDACVDTISQFYDRSVERGVDPKQKTSYLAFGRRVGKFAVWAGLPSDDLDELYEEHIYHPAVYRKGRKLSTDRRTMLRQFLQESAIEAWFSRPMELWNRADAARIKAQKLGRPIPEHAIADAECAAILAIISGVIPLRCANVVWLRHKGPYQTLFLPLIDGDTGYISIDGLEVKNDNDLYAELDDRARMFITGYLSLGYRRDFFHWNPKAKDSDFLFPGRCRAEVREDFFLPGARTIGCHTRLIGKRFAEVGLDVELHLARHITAKLMLDYDQGLLGTVADLLADLVSTVKAYYIDGDTGRASAILKQVIVDRMVDTKSKWTRDIAVMNSKKAGKRG